MMVMIATLQLALALTVTVSPVEKVITLLEDLATQVQEEGAKEAETYDKFACFCKSKTDGKVEAIDEKETSVQTLTADLESLNAEHAQLGADIKQLGEDISAGEADLKKMTDIREQEKAVYDAEFADADAAVNALHGAIGHIEGSKDSKVSLADVNAVQGSLATADALGFQTKGRAQLTAFLQQMPEVPEEDYSFHSGGIVSILEDLLKKFEDRKSALMTEEDAAVQSFDAAAGKLRDSIETSKSSLDTKEGQFSTAESDIATTTEELTETTALLADDKTYLKDLTGQCETKAREWDQRAKGRAGELEALKQATEIIGGTVADKAAATGSGGRGKASAAEKAPSKLGLVQATPEEYSDVVFTQRSVHRHGAASSAAMRLRVISILSAAARQQKSAAISMLAMQLAADPFAKVKTLIQKLIERLVTEAANEATQKGWCDTELGKANNDRDFRHKDTATLNAEIAGLEATKQKLEQDRTELTEQLAALNADFTEATGLRDDEKAENKQTLADAQEGVAALKNALKILQDFYKQAGKASVELLQASPVSQDLAGEGADAGFSGAYQGNQAAGAGIIGMLETIKSDFERTLKDTTAAEKQAHRNFVQYSQETKVSIKTKETGLKQTENDLTQTNGDLVASLTDLKDAQSLLDKSLETLEKLRPACIDTGMSYEERVARREAEIEALKNALAVLSENDGFLQK